MTHKVHASLIAGAALMLVSVTAHAGNDCAAGKIKAACKKAYCKAYFEAQAAKGLEIDPYKLQTCEMRFAASFAKLEAEPGCLTTGDGNAIEAKVDAFVADLDVELDKETGFNPNRCEAAKIKAAGKKMLCECALYADRAASPGNPPIPPVQIQKCETTFAERFAYAEQYRAPCNTTGDTSAIEAKVDAFVTDVDSELDPQ
jgi:hypothetical protein